jgi:hypothetical protein
MNIDELKVGMNVIPVNSTHPEGVGFEKIVKWSGYMPSGWLKVCRIDNDNNGEFTIHCWKNRIHTAWGREMYCEWKWLKFRPEDLVLVTNNESWFLKYRMGG